MNAALIVDVAFWSFLIVAVWALLIVMVVFDLPKTPAGARVPSTTEAAESPRSVPPAGHHS